MRQRRRWTKESRARLMVSVVGDVLIVVRYWDSLLFS